MEDKMSAVSNNKNVTFSDMPPPPPRTLRSNSQPNRLIVPMDSPTEKKESTPNNVQEKIETAFWRVVYRVKKEGAHGYLGRKWNNKVQYAAEALLDDGLLNNMKSINRQYLSALIRKRAKGE